MRGVLVPVLAAFLCCGALMMSAVGMLLRATRGPVDPPAWTTTAAVALAAYGLFTVVFLLAFRRMDLTKGLRQLRLKGIEPEAVVDVASMTILLSVTCIALLLCLVGLPVRYLYIATAYSVGGIAMWALLARRSPAC